MAGPSDTAVLTENPAQGCRAHQGRSTRGTRRPSAVPRSRWSPERATGWRPTLHRGAEPVDKIVDRGAPQLFLAREVVVEQRLGDARELGDGPSRRAVEAAVRKQIQRRVENRTSGLEAGRSGGNSGHEAQV